MECKCRFVGAEWITCQGCLAAIYQEQNKELNKQIGQAVGHDLKPSNNKKEGIVINVEFCKK